MDISEPVIRPSNIEPRVDVASDMRDVEFDGARDATPSAFVSAEGLE